MIQEQCICMYLSIYINIEIPFWAITEEVQHGDTRGLISLSILELCNFNEICFFLKCNLKKKPNLKWVLSTKSLFEEHSGNIGLTGGCAEFEHDD